MYTEHRNMKIQCFRLKNTKPSPLFLLNGMPNSEEISSNHWYQVSRASRRRAGGWKGKVAQRQLCCCCTCFTLLSWSGHPWCVCQLISFLSQLHVVCRGKADSTVRVCSATVTQFASLAAA